MSDLFLGETCTALLQFTSAGSAYTFQLPFDADKVTFTNLTKYGTTGQLPVSIWYKGMAAAAALQTQVIVDSGSTGNANLVLASSNGFTQANLPGGAPSYQTSISGVTQANPCVVSTTAPHGYQTGERVMITDLGDQMPTPRGMSQLNNNQYNIIVLSSTQFALYDIQSGNPIDSTNFEAWVAGGFVDMITRQQQTYNTPYVYNPVTYQLTAGSAVMGSNGDVFQVDVWKAGQVISLGQL